jgi:protein-disulfide isomerase
MKDYVDTGKMKLVFMDFPLGFHKNAQKASEAGLCAGDQGKFWEMHDKLFENYKALELEKLGTYAGSLGLNMKKFKACLDSGKYAKDIKKRTAEGGKAGITGTPAFLLGYIQSNGKVKATEKLVGASPYAKFKDAIDAMLKKGK